MECTLQSGRYYCIINKSQRQKHNDTREREENEKGRSRRQQHIHIPRSLTKPERNEPEKRELKEMREREENKIERHYITMTNFDKFCALMTPYRRYRQLMNFV